MGVSIGIIRMKKSDLFNKKFRPLLQHTKRGCVCVTPVCQFQFKPEKQMLNCCAMTGNPFDNIQIQHAFNKRTTHVRAQYNN